jgi:hypothetical protein
VTTLSWPSASRCHARVAAPEMTGTLFNERTAGTWSPTQLVPHEDLDGRRQARLA